jgi:hypothetical protein
MSEIKETIARYEKACKEERTKPNLYFMKVLQQEKAACEEYV